MMAIESDTTLKDAGVNSGIAVNLNSTHITWNLKKFLNSVQGPGKDSSSLSRNQRLAKSVLVGFDNPNLVVSCQIDIDGTSSNTLTFTLLKAFAESTNSQTLSTSAFGDIIVDLESVSADVDFPSEKGKKITVNIVFKEAQV